MLSFYVKYIPGDIYMNVIFSSTAEGIFCFITGYIANYFGDVPTLTASFFLGGLFSVALAFVEG